MQAGVVNRSGYERGTSREMAFRISQAVCTNRVLNMSDRNREREKERQRKRKRETDRETERYLLRKHRHSLHVLWVHLLAHGWSHDWPSCLLKGAAPS